MTDVMRWGDRLRSLHGFGKWPFDFPTDANLVIAVSENTEPTPPVQRFGFITIVEVPELGFAGGLLIVSPSGRPIEFHCTPPVAENRTQKILYGQTYRGFLFSDQIASSLVQKSKARPELLIADQSELLSLEGIVDTPVAMLCGPTDPTNRVTGVSVGDEFIVVQNESLDLQHWIKSACVEFTKSLPLVEPFERIRSAIEEAQSVAR